MMLLIRNERTQFPFCLRRKGRTPAKYIIMRKINKCWFVRNDYNRKLTKISLAAICEYGVEIRDVMPCHPHKWKCTYSECDKVPFFE